MLVSRIVKHFERLRNDIPERASKSARSHDTSAFERCNGRRASDSKGDAINDARDVTPRLLNSGYFAILLDRRLDFGDRALDLVVGQVALDPARSVSVSVLSSCGLELPELDRVGRRRRLVGERLGSPAHDDRPTGCRPRAPPRSSASRMICGAVVRIGVDVSIVDISPIGYTLHSPSVHRIEDVAVR